MIKLTEDDIENLYNNLKQQSASITTGHFDKGKISSILEKPHIVLYGYEQYGTIYKKAACYLEGITRLHPFSDGNKRMAILCAVTFFRLNGHSLAVPLDTIKFLVGVANDPGRTEEEVNELIDRIALWLEERTASNEKEYQQKVHKYLGAPCRNLLLLCLTGVGVIFARRKISDWFAVKSHPEYRKRIPDMMRFILSMSLSSNVFKT